MLIPLKWIAGLTLSLGTLLPRKFSNRGADECVKNVEAANSNMEKYQVLRNLQNENEDKFYSCLVRNVVKLLPVVYTPVIGEVCQNYAKVTGESRGIILNINEVDKIEEKFREWKSIHGDVDAIVVTDGGRVLGLGDLGANGMGISVGKMVLYTALGGVNPKRCLPIALDVGTNNEVLRSDETRYVGMKIKRKKLNDPDYKEFVDKFMAAALNVFGSHTLVQFEDFANEEANYFLEKYQKEQKKTMFNDDIQGTAAVALAGILTAEGVVKKKLKDSIVLFAGAGEAALGIANLMASHIKKEHGLSEEESRKNIYLKKSDKLITEGDKFTNDRRHYRHRVEEGKNTTDLLEIIKWLQPNILIGVSSKGGLFSPAVLEEMARTNQRPIIFALSNPTEMSECTAEEAYRHTQGKVIFASGSPFPAVKYNRRLYRPRQCNNAYIFPGVALGVTAVKMTSIDDTVFLIAAETLAKECTKKKDVRQGSLFPELTKVRECSVRIATAVARYAFEKNLSALPKAPRNIKKLITESVYKPSGLQ